MNKILKLLSSMGYKIFWKILKSSNYGTGKMRERIYFIEIKNELLTKKFKFSFPKKTKNPKNGKISDWWKENFEFNKKLKGRNLFKKYLNNKYNKKFLDIQKILKKEYSFFRY